MAYSLVPQNAAWKAGRKAGKKAGIKVQRAKRSKNRMSVSSKALVSSVRSILNGELETKYACDNRVVGFNSAIGSWAEAYPILPPIAPNATGAGQTFARIGTQITPISSKLTITVAPTAVNRTMSMQVDIYVCTRKQNKFFPTLASLPGALQLFMTGTTGAQTQAYDGALVSTYLRQNRNEFTILKHKRVVLLANVGIPNADTTAGNAPNVATNAAAHRMVFKLKAPKTLKYDETSGTATYPNNWAPFFVLGYSKLDGSAPDVVNQNVLATWSSSLTFKDA